MLDFVKKEEFLRMGKKVDLNSAKTDKRLNTLETTIYQSERTEEEREKERIKREEEREKARIEREEEREKARIEREEEREKARIKREKERKILEKRIIIVLTQVLIAIIAGVFLPFYIAEILAGLVVVISAALFAIKSEKAEKTLLINAVLYFTFPVIIFITSAIIDVQKSTSNVNPTETTTTQYTDETPETTEFPHQDTATSETPNTTAPPDTTTTPPKTTQPQETLPVPQHLPECYADEEGNKECLGCV